MGSARRTLAWCCRISSIACPHTNTYIAIATPRPWRIRLPRRMGRSLRGQQSSRSTALPPSWLHHSSPGIPLRGVLGVDCGHRLDQRPALPFNLADQESLAALGRAHEVGRRCGLPMFVALVVHVGKRTPSTWQSTIHWSARCMIPLDESICVVPMDDPLELLRLCTWTEVRGSRFPKRVPRPTDLAPPRIQCWRCRASVGAAQCPIRSSMRCGQCSQTSVSAGKPPTRWPNGPLLCWPTPTAMSCLDGFC